MRRGASGVSGWGNFGSCLRRSCLRLLREGAQGDVFPLALGELWGVGGLSSASGHSSVLESHFLLKRIGMAKFSLHLQRTVLLDLVRLGGAVISMNEQTNGPSPTSRMWQWADA